MPGQVKFTDSYRSSLRETLLKTYFTQWDPCYLSTQEGESDVEDHLTRRVTEFETAVIPWVEEVYPLSGKEVLEIGCGTGASTVPFAFRVGSVRALDISPEALAVAKERVRLLGATNVRFEELPLSWAKSQAECQSFLKQSSDVDVVLLIALLEHLTIPERLNALKAAWSMLRNEGILVVYETPNRLGFSDWHTYGLPFFHCLPDALAIQYAANKERTALALFRPSYGDPVERLYRLGRGVSYHEFELALGLSSFTVINDGYSSYLGHRSAMENLQYDRSIEAIFRNLLPGVPRGFSRPSLDLILQKTPSHRTSPTGRTNPCDGSPSPSEDPRLLEAREQLKACESRLQGYERRTQEYERVLSSQTELTRAFVGLTTQNLMSLIRQPTRLTGRVWSWWKRRLG